MKESIRNLVSPPYIAQIEALLQRELLLQRRSLGLLTQERIAVRDFQSADVEYLASAREGLFDELTLLAEKRTKLLSEIPEGNSTRISELVKRHAAPKDAARIAVIIADIRAVISKIQRESTEQNQVLEFARGLVHGTLSIIWSATQNVTRAYTRLGAMKESYAPSSSRKQTVLKEA